MRQGHPRTNDWALQIKGLNKTTDAGLYQCQTSGDSPQLQSYQLNIVGECPLLWALTFGRTAMRR